MNTEYEYPSPDYNKDAYSYIETVGSAKAEPVTQIEALPPLKS